MTGERLRGGAKVVDGVRCSPLSPATRDHVAERRALSLVTVSEPVCRPVADLRSVTPKRAATGTAWASLEVGDTSAGASVVLTSYPGARRRRR